MPQRLARSTYSLALEDGRFERVAGIVEELVGSDVSLNLSAVGGASVVCETKAKRCGGAAAGHEQGHERDSGEKVEGLDERGKLLRA